MNQIGILEELIKLLVSHLFTLYWVPFLFFFFFLGVKKCNYWPNQALLLLFKRFFHLTLQATAMEESNPPLSWKKKCWKISLNMEFIHFVNYRYILAYFEFERIQTFKIALFLLITFCCQPATHFRLMIHITVSGYSTAKN